MSEQDKQGARSEPRPDPASTGYVPGRRPCRRCGKQARVRDMRQIAGQWFCGPCATLLSDAQIRTLPTAVATATAVACPKCKGSFGITPAQHNQVALCESCKTVFLILPPPDPPATHP